MRHSFDNSQPDPDPEFPAIQHHRHPRMHPQMTALLHSFPGMSHKLSMWPDDVLANDVLLWTHQTGSHGERLVIQFLRLFGIRASTGRRRGSRISIWRRPSRPGPHRAETRRLLRAGWQRHSSPEPSYPCEPS